jgi:hypothetical protein
VLRGRHRGEERKQIRGSSISKRAQDETRGSLRDGGSQEEREAMKVRERQGEERGDGEGARRRQEREGVGGRGGGGCRVRHERARVGRNEPMRQEQAQKVKKQMRVQHTSINVCSIFVASLTHFLISS